MISLFDLFLVYTFLSGGFIYCFVRVHLLVMLLSLEFVVLVIFILFVLGLGVYGHFYALAYLVMSACEGALGLSVLIAMGRSCGGDYLSGVSVLGLN